ncbi:MAG: DUF192 domain-containing protein [Rhodospirillales bacterium]|nr:DUF192 domain-containing protein [Rhodospirillales bacterium]
MERRGAAARRVTVLAVACALALAGLGLSALAQESQFKTSVLTVLTARGSFPFTVELALTGEEQEQGLQGRPALPADRGMLFDFGRTRVISMWMKNTVVALDMVFIAADGRVVKIVENTTPLSLATISSGEPARGVLEVAAGTAKRLGLKRGDRVIHPTFREGAT